MKIKIVKEIIRRIYKRPIKVCPVGTILESTFEAPDYYLTPFGGIYKDEAVPFTEVSKQVPS